MIAKNYRKHPEAMALQLVLQFGKALVWATARPTTDAARKVRALRGIAFKRAGRIRWPVAAIVPTWWRQAKSAAQVFAQALRMRQVELNG